MRYLIQITNAQGKDVYWRGHQYFRMGDDRTLSPPPSWTPKISIAKDYPSLREARLAVGELADFYGMQSYRVIHIQEKKLFDCKLKGL